MRNRALLPIVVGACVIVVVTGLWVTRLCACVPYRPEDPSRPPSLGRTFRDVALDENRIYAASGHFAVTIEELSRVRLPVETRIVSLQGAVDSFQVRIDSGIPVSKSCEVEGAAPVGDDSARFTLACSNER